MAKTLYHRIDSNEQKLNRIGILLENLMMTIGDKNGTNQNRTGNPTDGSHGETPSVERGQAL